MEAYPTNPPNRVDYAHDGTISMFEREGFEIFSRPDTPYVLMQKVV